MRHELPRDIPSLSTSVSHFNERFAYHFALDYCERGWSVIPIDIGTKKPGISTWKHFQTERASPDQLSEWFAGDEPRHTNLAIVTGSVSGLVVVDCDDEQGAKHWLDHHPASPLIARTGGGGLHIYYRAPSSEIVGNRVRMGGHRIDLRGEHGYVVAPPSRHVSGNLYSWMNWGDYALEQIPVMDPGWLAPVDRSHPHASRRIQVRDGAAYIRQIRAVSGQGGHNATYRAASRLFDAGLTAEEALTELMIWNQTNAEPPWSPHELLHKIQSVYGKHRST